MAHNPITLYRAMWSPSWSHCLTGYDSSGEFVHTKPAYVTEKENVYRTAEGQEVIVQSWAPSGREYKDEKK